MIQKRLRLRIIFSVIALQAHRKVLDFTNAIDLLKLMDLVLNLRGSDFIQFVLKNNV